MVVCGVLGDEAAVVGVWWAGVGGGSGGVRWTGAGGGSGGVRWTGVGRGSGGVRWTGAGSSSGWCAVLHLPHVCFSVQFCVEFGEPGPPVGSGQDGGYQCSCG